MWPRRSQPQTAPFDARPKAVSMLSRHRPITRLVLLTGILLTASCPSSSRATRIHAASRPGAMANLDSIRPTEVRLRKLHLVRPDLIPYPIEYEVVC